jgi:SAM-dependent methyltransferase
MLTGMTPTNIHRTPITRDPWSVIGELDDEAVTALAERLTVRAADPRQRQLWADFLSRADFCAGARVLDVGCGTGVITQMIGDLPDVTEVVGIDPSAGLVARARDRLTAVTFHIGDGQALPYDDQTFDGVVFATTLCHIPDPTAALEEAQRVLRPGGSLLVFEGDYNTANVGLAAHDPLQTCVAAGVARMVNDPWIVRHLASIVRTAGFDVGEMRSHGYVEQEASYIPTLVAAGTTSMLESGTITQTLADALVAEAGDRAEAGRFFGHIAYASLTAIRPFRGAPESVREPTNSSTTVPSPAIVSSRSTGHPERVIRRRRPSG